MRTTFLLISRRSFPAIFTTRTWSIPLERLTVRPGPERIGENLRLCLEKLSPWASSDARSCLFSEHGSGRCEGFPLAVLPLSFWTCGKAISYRPAGGSRSRGGDRALSIQSRRRPSGVPATFDQRVVGLRTHVARSAHGVSLERVHRARAACSEARRVASRCGTSGPALVRRSAMMTNVWSGQWHGAQAGPG
jgi:hypothetical protein